MTEIKDQPTPKGVGEAIQDLVIEDLQERKRIGIKRYGEALKKFNGRDALIDLYQELIDATMYIRQQIEEEKDPRGQAREYYKKYPEHLKEDFSGVIQ